jgi:hypothetical protein
MAKQAATTIFGQNIETEIPDTTVLEWRTETVLNPKNGFKESNINDQLSSGAADPQQQINNSTYTRINNDPIPFNVPVRQPRYKEKSIFKLLNEWEGHVIECSSDEFLAAIKDLTNKEYPDEEVVFNLEEVAESDRSLIKPGAVFYLLIGYKDQHGTRERSSMIQFRRLPAWTKQELTKIKKEAKDIADLLGWK